jgi:hypothetical protein
MVIRIKPQMLSDDFSELSACLDRLQTTVEFDRGPCVSVAEEPSDCFVIAGMVFQVDRSRSMPELVEGDP